MMGTLFLAEFRRIFTQMRRYPSELISEVLVIVVIFYGMFLGSQYMSNGHVYQSRLSSIVIGYTLWILVLDAVGNMGYNITTEAANGTLEQVFLSPAGPLRVLLARSLANLVFTCLFAIVTLFSIMAITGHWLRMSWWDIIPFVMAIAVSIGIGFLVASVSMLFKRANQFLGLLQFFLLFVVMTPFTTWPGAFHAIAVIVPLAPMVGLLDKMMIHNTGLFTEGYWFWWGWLNLVLWIGVGMWVFQMAFNRARRKGTLGHY